MAGGEPPSQEGEVALLTIAREWGRIGATGFGGPPAHIALLRKLCVEERQWLTPHEFEDAVSATSLLPGPASTQLAIFCGWRLRGPLGALVAGLCFIFPGLVAILVLSALVLASHPPEAVLGAAAGAGAAVPAVAVRAAADLVPTSWRRFEAAAGRHWPWVVYFAAGVACAALEGTFVVLVLLVCGGAEIARRSGKGAGLSAIWVGPGLLATASGGLAALAWLAFKVGALSYGGGFVIIPLMQHDAVTTFHFMTGAQFLSAVALGQVTPGPVVLTVAVVGYAAHGLEGALLATVIAFSPSFLFVMVGGRSFDRIRTSQRAQAFLSGSGPAAIGAISGASITLARELSHVWQIGVLAGVAVYLLGLRKGTVTAIVGAALVGVVAALAGAPVGGK